jgi:hypothetical protein
MIGLALYGLDLLFGYCFEAIALGGFLGGILWGNWVGFPIWELRPSLLLLVQILLEAGEDLADLFGWAKVFQRVAD